MAPELGATFVPGGFDDYYMPEVVAPSPQRYASLITCRGAWAACWNQTAADPLPKKRLLRLEHY